MATESGKKGRALEDAVEFIHDSILRSDPKYRGLNFKIDTRILKKVRNRTYEIDVLVETLPGTDFPATWIFECKNWKEPVGQKEAHYLSAKVEALGASKGFLVAETLTKGAEEVIAEDPRLQFIHCTEDFFSPLNSAEMVYVSQDVLDAQVTFQWEGMLAGKHAGPLDYKTLKCKWRNQPIDFHSLALPMIDRIAIGDRDAYFAMRRVEGTHWREVTQLVPFKSKELFIEDTGVAFFSIRLAYFATFRRRRIITKFELKGRGRFFVFESIDSPVTGENIEIQILQRI